MNPARRQLPHVKTLDVVSLPFLLGLLLIFLVLAMVFSYESL